MKHKKIIVFILLLLIIYFIYITFHDDKINYLSIGDFLSVGVNSYNENSYGYSDYLKDYLSKKSIKDIADKARNYDVRTQVIRLEEWYISHEKKAYMEG